jgi:hypothetical protein
MEPNEKLLSYLLASSKQRAGALAILSGVLITTECEITKMMVANHILKVISDLPVGDEIEQRMITAANEALNSDKEIPKMSDVVLAFLQSLSKDMEKENPETNESKN